MGFVYLWASRCSYLEMRKILEKYIPEIPKTKIFIKNLYLNMKNFVENSFSNIVQNLKELLYSLTIDFSLDV